MLISSVIFGRVNAKQSVRGALSISVWKLCRLGCTIAVCLCMVTTVWYTPIFVVPICHGLLRFLICVRVKFYGGIILICGFVFVGIQVQMFTLRWGSTFAKICPYDSSVTLGICVIIVERN